MAGRKKRRGERRAPASEPADDSDRDSDDAPRRPRRSRGRRRSGLRIGRLAYWGAVSALWLVIAAIGTIVWVGLHLPPIQSLEIPKRPPSIQILGLDGRVLATRGEMGGA